MFKKIRNLAAVATAAALLMAACSSGSTSSGEDQSAGLKGAPIVLGSLCSCTGPLAASLGKSKDVIAAWAKWTNANGGINGHPVKVITYDDGQNPTKGLALAKKLVEEDKVQAIVGNMSLVSNSWAKYVSGKDIPVIGGQPVDTSFFTDPNFYTSGTTLPVLLLSEVSLAVQAGAKKIGVYYCSETPVCAQLPVIIGALAKQAGVSVESAKVTQSAANYIAECTAFKQKGVDAVFAGVNSDVVPRIAKSCKEQDYEPIQVASSATTQKSWTTDPNMDGSLVGATNAVYTDASVPGVKDFLGAVDKYAAGLSKSPQFSYPLIYPWAGGQLYAAAAKAGNISPTSTGADVKKGLYALQGETLDGVAPPLTFAEGKPGFPLCYFTAELKDKAFLATGGGKPVCIDEKTAAGLQAALAG
jgi:branched-chain amino acid transport system substrate-binding protein